MQALFNRNTPIDLVTVSEELTAGGVLEAVGGIQYISYLATTLPTTANIVQHIDIVCEKSLRRKLIHTANDIIDKSYNAGGSSQEVADNAGKLIFDALEDNSQRGMVHIRDLLLQITRQPYGYVSKQGQAHRRSNRL